MCGRSGGGGGRFSPFFAAVAGNWRVGGEEEAFSFYRCCSREWGGGWRRFSPFIAAVVGGWGGRIRRFSLVSLL